MGMAATAAIVAAAVATAATTTTAATTIAVTTTLLTALLAAPLVATFAARGLFAAAAALTVLAATTTAAVPALTAAIIIALAAVLGLFRGRFGGGCAAEERLQPTEEAARFLGRGDALRARRALFAALLETFRTDRRVALRLVAGIARLLTTIVRRASAAGAFVATGAIRAGFARRAKIVVLPRLGRNDLGPFGGEDVEFRLLFGLGRGRGLGSGRLAFEWKQFFRSRSGGGSRHKGFGSGHEGFGGGGRGGGRSDGLRRGLRGGRGERIFVFAGSGHDFDRGRLVGGVGERSRFSGGRWGTGAFAAGQT